MVDSVNSVRWEHHARAEQTRADGYRDMILLLLGVIEERMPSSAVPARMRQEITHLDQNTALAKAHIDALVLKDKANG